MKQYTINVNGKTITDIIDAINEAKQRIESGNSMGFDSNEDSYFEFSSEGYFEEETTVKQ